MNSREDGATAARHAVDQHRRAMPNPWVWAAGLAAVALAVLIWGGYGGHWHWTGLSGSVTLWDWLEVLALPVAVGLAPLLVRHRGRLSPRHQAALTTGVTVFAALAVAGYLVPLQWTGFRGNTAWDWLELWLLPLVVAVASWQRGWRLRRPHLLVAALAGVVFIGLVFAGYLVPLTWTGFTGNTAWDWIKLLLVPVLVPTVLLPALSDRVDRRLGAGPVIDDAVVVAGVGVGISDQ